MLSTVSAPWRPFFCGNGPFESDMAASCLADVVLRTCPHFGYWWTATQRRPLACLSTLLSLPSEQLIFEFFPLLESGTTGGDHSPPVPCQGTFAGAASYGTLLSLVVYRMGFIGTVRRRG